MSFVPYFTHHPFHLNAQKIDWGEELFLLCVVLYISDTGSFIIAGGSIFFSSTVWKFLYGMLTAKTWLLINCLWGEMSKNATCMTGSFDEWGNFLILFKPLFSPGPDLGTKVDQGTKFSSFRCCGTTFVKLTFKLIAIKFIAREPIQDIKVKLPCSTSDLRLDNTKVVMLHRLVVSLFLEFSVLRWLGFVLPMLTIIVAEKYNN